MRSKGWIGAKEMRSGDEVSSHDGQWITVEAVTDLNEVATVYNLRVSDYHTYFVGSREWGFSVWAHNTICGEAVRTALVPHLGEAAARGLSAETLEAIAAAYRSGNHTLAETLLGRIPGLGQRAATVATNLSEQVATNIRARWPWTDLTPTPSVMRADGGRCEPWARAIHEAIGGELMHVTPQGVGAQFIGPVRNRFGNVISTEFREHWAVRIGDMVFDRITGPAGMHINDYKRLFENAAHLNF